MAFIITSILNWITGQAISTSAEMKTASELVTLPCGQPCFNLDEYMKILQKADVYDINLYIQHPLWKNNDFGDVFRSAKKTLAEHLADDYNLKHFESIKYNKEILYYLNTDQNTLKTIIKKNIETDLNSNLKIHHKKYLDNECKKNDPNCPHCIVNISIRDFNIGYCNISNSDDNNNFI